MVMINMLKENFDSNTLSTITITYKRIPIAHEHDDKQFKTLVCLTFSYNLSE
jgi:hypothetical protein